MGISKHLLTDYVPYLYGQVLECLDPERAPLLERQVQRNRFTARCTSR